MAKDFTNKQFSKSLRGYSTEDVDNYLQYVNNEFSKLERHCTESDKRLVFALRKLEALTKEMQKLYEIPDLNGDSVIVQNPDENASEKAPVQRSMTDEELKQAKAEIESAKKESDRIRREAEGIKRNAEAEATDLINAANQRAAKIISDAKLQADAVVASSGKRAREAAEQIITDAALAGRKIIRDAEEKADNACRDILDIHQAAGSMYNEINAFRNSLFSIYNTHIESIENISENAEGLVERVDGIIRTLEGESTAEETPVAADIPDASDTAAEPEEETAVPADAAETFEEPENIEAPEETVFSSDTSVIESTEISELTDVIEVTEAAEIAEISEYAETDGYRENSAAADLTGESKYAGAEYEDQQDGNIINEPEENTVTAEAVDTVEETVTDPETDDDTDPDQISFSTEDVLINEELTNSEPEEYYDSFDIIPEDDEEVIEEPDEEIIPEEEIGNDAGNGSEDDELPWDDEPAAEAAEEAESEDDENAGETGDAPIEPFTMEELHAIFDFLDERKPEDAPLEPAPIVEEDTGDDFELPDDVGNATNVLDIVKKIGDSQSQKPQVHESDDFTDFLSIGTISDDEFNKVFSNSDSSIDTIMKQPIITPDEPTNPKKHSHF